MIAHILGKGGSKPCPHVSATAKKVAKSLRKEKSGPSKDKRPRESSNSDESTMSKKPVKRKLLTQVEKSMKQPQLKVFRGIQVPFTSDQELIVCEQFLRATISANLPFRWVEDPEVMTLFLLFRSTAGEVIPSRLQIAGDLLDKADSAVRKRVRAELKGKYAVLAADGWKDDSRNAVNGVNVSVDGKVSQYHTSVECCTHWFDPRNRPFLSTSLLPPHIRKTETLCVLHLRAWWIRPRLFMV